MSLFGASPASTSASTANTQGDLSKDVELAAPPEDSISGLSFSPQSEHLAVASWDSKVRIYEISETGQSMGKALYEHQGPVLSVHWSKVGLPAWFELRRASASLILILLLRTAPRLFPVELIKLLVCSMSSPASPSRSLPTTNLSVVSECSSHQTRGRCLSRVPGTRLSSIGTFGSSSQPQPCRCRNECILLTFAKAC